MATTVTPNVLASAISKRVGRDVSPKSVRGAARAMIARFSKAKHPEHQAHAYTAAEVRLLTDVFVRRSGGQVAKRTRRSRKASDATVAAD